MPGRNPRDAFEAFMKPIQGAASCLGRLKITPSPGGTTQPNTVHAWSLNGDVGVSVLGWHFEAGMLYEIVRGDTDDWRVTTRGYRYRLAYSGEDLWRLHWHPDGDSDVKYPHLHANFDGAPGGANLIEAHLPMTRTTLEDAIRWSAECGLPMARNDWRDVLRISEADHIRYRSWGGNAPPPGAHGG